ncbi:hypothetical protein B0H16DRAFT_238530 [Mycena metata]|uniref:Uncharacterized protein n=1 Tax=Mycena metata TaxID=1033252 RepID=A0AAD7JR31_9AGAR|nr:hypothetical protein B0H16DRAFT_238530 [Mycena metata]
MSDPAKQHKRDKLKDTGHKVASKIKKWAGITPKPTPTPSPQPSRSPTPAPYNGEGPPPGATAINPESTPSRVDNGEDSSKGGDTVKTDTPDTAQSKPDPDWQAWKIDDKSISQLRDWGTGQENSKWRKLADKIDHCLNSKTSEALQEFIPDSPFPAKTLVKALKRCTSLLRMLSSISVLLSRLPVRNRLRRSTWSRFVRR